MREKTARKNAARPVGQLPFFPRGLFTAKLDGLSKRRTTRSLTYVKFIKLFRRYYRINFRSKIIWQQITKRKQRKDTWRRTFQHKTLEHVAHLKSAEWLVLRLVALKLREQTGDILLHTTTQRTEQSSSFNGG